MVSTDLTLCIRGSTSAKAIRQKLGGAILVDSGELAKPGLILGPPSIAPSIGFRNRALCIAQDW